ncbi:MAG: GC-type dockerin domain-anchored protein [Phycisphaerales bacterium JB040]
MNTHAAAVAALAALSSVASAQTVYGLTRTDLVRWDASDPSDVTVVGAHGLSSPVRPQGSPYGVGELCYDSARDRLVTLYLVYRTADDTWDQYLAEIDRATGAGSVLFSLGNTAVTQLYDSIAYDPGRDLYLVPNTDDVFFDLFGELFLSSEIIGVDPDTGATSLLAINDRDNDSSAFNTLTGQFLAIDVNGTNFNTLQLTTTNLDTSGLAQLGTIPLFLTDITHDPATNTVYSYMVQNSDPSFAAFSRHQIEMDLSVNPLAWSSGGQVDHPDTIGGLTLAPLVQSCPGDINNDGVLDNGDIGAFVSLFLAGSLRADFTNDGILDNGDIGAFVQIFLAGC